MLSELDRLLAELRREGPRRFARWDTALFDAVANSRLPILREGLLGQSDADPVLGGFLRLVHQAVGTGALRQATSGVTWTSFLERCLLDLIPDLLPRTMSGQRLPLLIKVWNLGEGLLREPQWLDRYVTACAGRIDDLADLEKFLVATLEPVLMPAPPASWRGPYVVTVLDVRSLHDEFLPGTVGLAAPTVLRVEDRRGRMQAGILLRSGGRSELLGLTEGLRDYSEVWEQPSVEFHDCRARVAGQQIELPFLRRHHGHAIARAGFIAACAVDSQRVWIVESP